MPGPHPGLALFPTAAGTCAIAWTEGGIAGLQLPEETDDGTREALLRRVPGARAAEPPESARRAMAAVCALLRGEAAETAAIALDLSGVPPFHRRVYRVARGIPPGETVTYGELALLVGAPRAARAVGQALARNPFALLVPCHRVVARGGAGGFTAHGGVATKERLLRLERG